MKKVILVSGFIIAVFILTSVMMAADTQPFGRNIRADNDNRSKEFMNVGELAVPSIPLSGDPLPLQSWGSYKKIELAGESYFAAYLNGFLYNVSSDKKLADGQLSKILQNGHDPQAGIMPKG